MIDEPEGIGEFPIAKQYGDVLAFQPDMVGLIEISVAMPWLLGRVKGASKDAFVRR